MRWQGFISYSPCYLHVLWSCVSLCCIAGNGIGLGEGGLVGRSILAEYFCPLLPSPCYTLARLIIIKLNLEHGKKENKNFREAIKTLNN